MAKFVPRKRKQRDREKERARQHQSATGPGGIANSNTAEIVPSSKTEREERREQLKKELQAQQSKISSKKQKRLDKYIVRV
jgi:ATP-dependent RNA helicase DHX37/DHR1